MGVKELIEGDGAIDGAVKKVGEKWPSMCQTFTKKCLAIAPDSDLTQGCLASPSPLK
jgi:hypothetical protein